MHLKCVWILMTTNGWIWAQSLTEGFEKKGCGGSSCPYFHHSLLQEIPQSRFQQNPEKLVADCGGRRPSERPINGGGRDVWGGRKNTVKLPKSLINSPIIRCNYWKTFSDEVLNIYTHILCSFQSSHPIFWVVANVANAILCEFLFRSSNGSSGCTTRGSRSFAGEL